MITYKNLYFFQKLKEIISSIFISPKKGSYICLNLCTKKTVIFYCAKMLKWFKIKTISPFPDFSLVYFGFKNIMCSFLSNNFYFLLVGLSDKLIWYGISPGQYFRVIPGSKSRRNWQECLFRIQIPGLHERSVESEALVRNTGACILIGVSMSLMFTTVWQPLLLSLMYFSLDRKLLIRTIYIKAIMECSSM